MAHQDRIHDHPIIRRFLIEGYAAYMDRVRELESHPENQDGSDKTWVEKAMWECQMHYRRAEQVS